MKLYKTHSFASLLLALCAGVYAADGDGISFLVFLPNFIGLLIGTIAMVFSDQVAALVFKNHQSLAFAFATLLFLTLTAPGAEGVHRWIPLGPLQVYVSMAFAPLLLYALLRLAKSTTLILLVIVEIIYISQPDAAQATAFAMACSLILGFRKDFSNSIKLFGILICAIGAVGSWVRVDPLLPVRQVEDILKIAFASHLLTVVLMMMAILFLFSPLVVVFIKSRDEKTRLLAASFFIYWLVTFVMTEVGHFPVPVIGAGAAGVLGWSLSFLFVQVFNIQHQNLARNFNADSYSRT